MYDNSVGTSMFKVWARLVGLRGLYTIFSPFFKRLTRDLDMDEFFAGDFELNPVMDTGDGDLHVMASSTELHLLLDQTFELVLRGVRHIPHEMAVFMGDLWDVLSEDRERDVAVAVFRHCVGGLFVHRYLLCAVMDPLGYCIITAEPDDNMHRKLSYIGQVLGKWAFGELFTEKERFMMELNNVLEDRAGDMAALCAAFSDGSFLRNKSEHARVPKETYDTSLRAYGAFLAQNGLTLNCKTIDI